MQGSSADRADGAGAVAGAASLLDDELAHALLLAMLEAPGPGGTSLPRLAKRLKASVSVLLRRLTLMSAATLGGQAGPAWVRVEQGDNRWVAYLTDAGRTHATALQATALHATPTERTNTEANTIGE